jgi:REP element-mobilizing transposase RayT
MVPRRLRLDHPGSWHHVVNRGIARRPLFESVRDVRFFLSCLARQVRAGRIEVHAYSILTTHFHLLVRSPGAGLSAAMQQSQDAYARWFNRGRRRDGPLFRGRYTNRIIDTDGYWDSVVRYIDQNPVSAGLAAAPWEFPFGSAYHYCRERRGPPWLRRTELESWVGGLPGAPQDPLAYRRFCAPPLPPGRRWVMDRRLSSELTAGGNRLEALLSRATSKDLSWMEFKAALADGGTVGHPLVSPDSVTEAVRRRSAVDPERTLQAGGKPGPWWETLCAGSLRAGCGETLDAIAARMGLNITAVRRRVRLYRDGVTDNGQFLQEAVSILRDAWALEQGHPDPLRGRTRFRHLGEKNGSGMVPTA